MSDDPLIPSANEIAAAIMKVITSLPPEQQEPAIHRVINDIMGRLPYAAVVGLRAEVASQFPVDHGIAIVDTTLDLIDGHLVLRELGVVDEPGASPSL